MASSTMSNDKQRLADLDKKIRDGLLEVGKNGTSEDLVQFYNINAKEYNEMTTLTSYDCKSRAVLATSLAALVSDKDAKILDVAAGSGLVGKEVRKLGFNNIDALEPAEKFLELAKSENIYNNYIVDSINAKKQCGIADDTYDALVIMAAFFKGHLEPNCLPELMRLTKKGGVIVFNISEKFQNSDPEYAAHKLELEFQSYVDNGLWVKWDAIRDAPYRYNERCNIYRITVA